MLGERTEPGTWWTPHSSCPSLKLLSQTPWSSRLSDGPPNNRNPQFFQIFSFSSELILYPIKMRMRVMIWISFTRIFDGLSYGRNVFG